MYKRQAQFRLGEDTTFLLQTEFLEDRRLTDFGIPAYHGRPVDVDPSTYYGAENARDTDVRVITRTWHFVNDTLETQAP